MIGRSVEALLISAAYFVCVAAFTQTVLYFIRPVTRLAKGPLRHPRFPVQALSLYFFQFAEVRFRRKADFWLTLASFALCFILLALVPVTGSFAIYFERPDVVFVLFYLLARLLYSSVIGRSANAFKTEFDQPLVASVLLIFLFCILGIKRGGGAHVNEIVFHAVALGSVGAFLSFLTVLFFSGIFFFPRPAGLKGISFVTLPHAMSKVVWFSLLIWIFFGVFSSQPASNFFLFALASSALTIVYEIFSYFFPRVSANLNFALMKKYLVPAVLLMLLLSWAEGKIAW